MLHPIISIRRSQSKDWFLQGLWSGGLLNFSPLDPEIPFLILDPFFKAPRPRNLPLHSCSSSYFNIFWCVNVWVSFSDSGSLHLIKGFSTPPKSISLSLSPPGRFPPLPPSLGSSSPGLGPQSSPASWPVPPYKRATHRQEVTAKCSTPSASLPLAGLPWLLALAPRLRGTSVPSPGADIGYYILYHIIVQSARGGLSL